MNDGWYKSCLIVRETNEIIYTEFREIVKAGEIKKISKEHRWDFDWTLQWKKKESNSEFYALTIEGETETQGIIELRKEQGAIEATLVESAPGNRGSTGKYRGVGGHLFAIAVKRSYEIGNDGYVFFDAKTALIGHYKKELGASVIRGNRMYIDGRAAKKLFNTYFEECLK
ncbi:MAG: hypothetical protein AB9903_15655 [Vulcanimicrobiota bacterium]